VFGQKCAITGILIILGALFKLDSKSKDNICSNLGAFSKMAALCASRTPWSYSVVEALSAAAAKSSLIATPYPASARNVNTPTGSF
jgi:hypothetical protein